MATVEELEDEIVSAELDDEIAHRLDAILGATQYVTTVLQGIESWLTAQGDEKAARLVGKCALQMATHEAENS